MMREVEKHHTQVIFVTLCLNFMLSATRNTQMSREHCQTIIYNRKSMAQLQTYHDRTVCLLTGRARRPLFRKAKKRHMVALEEFQGSTAQVGESVKRKSINLAFHKSGPKIV
ncbi:hypothetical protein ATANTOWER_029761 [Ataeniobius toweri]|uniref:Secreted protein n=1 Tax=Ataeniobius toweri TaxID=208326 RepID=A0ABU7CIX4_9TELE|nr:hypothetical protein [Ataeniobius toweri]